MRSASSPGAGLREYDWLLGIAVNIAWAAGMVWISVPTGVLAVVVLAAMHGVSERLAYWQRHHIEALKERHG